MNKEVKFTTDRFDCEMDVQGTVIPEYSQNRQPNGMSERCPPHVEDLDVVISVGGIGINITDRLTENLRDKIEAECFKRAQLDDGGPDPDRDRG